MNIIIGADIVPTQSNFVLFSNSNVTTLLGDELFSLLNSVDVRIFNLEVPLCDKQDPIQKFGPNHIAPINTVNGIKAINPTLLTFANNHILDQGEKGLKSTKEILNKHKIPFIGVGNNLSEASKPFILEQDGAKIGIYACTEHEFSIATENTSGANPFDPLESFDHIQSLKEKCDYVIVLYHGGKEYYRYPSPYLQKVCRKMVQKGADLSICQHSHCIGCFEQYRNGTIVYGQGNFLFDDCESEFDKTSLLIKVSISDKFQVDYIPIMKVGNGVRLAEGQVYEKILSSFRKRSLAILKKGFIEQQYSKLALKNLDSYLQRFSGFSKWLSHIDRRLLNGMFMNKKYNKKQLFAIQNYIECEAHRELIIAGLKNKIHQLVNEKNER